MKITIILAAALSLFASGLPAADSTSAPAKPNVILIAVDFLVPGFHKPHMPWNVPQQYYDMHPLAEIELPPVKADDLADIPAAGVKMARMSGDHARVVESGRWKEAVQAYLAAISYLDGQVGRVLDALEKSACNDNTIICLWGDHGWHLGEKEHWRKFALWEEATLLKNFPASDSEAASEKKGPRKGKAQAE